MSKEQRKKLCAVMGCHRAGVCPPGTDATFILSVASLVAAASLLRPLWLQMATAVRVLCLVVPQHPRREQGGSSLCHTGLSKTRTHPGWRPFHQTTKTGDGERAVTQRKCGAADQSVTSLEATHNCPPQPLPDPLPACWTSPWRPSVPINLPLTSIPCLALCLPECRALGADQGSPGTVLMS